MSKERLTILACNSAAGTNNLPLMAIGKSARPRALKAVNKNALPVYYRHQNKPWMNGLLFDEWFFKEIFPYVTRFNNDNSLPNRVLLFVDIAPSHPSGGQLDKGGIEVEFLPPSIFGAAYGVLQRIKTEYSNKFLEWLINHEDVSLSTREKMEKKST